MNKAIDSIYFLLLSILCTFTYLLNFYNKIYQCSAMFVLMMFALNAMNELYGSKKAFFGMLASLVVSVTLLWNVNYYIHGKVINNIVFASLGSVLITSIIVVPLFSGLKQFTTFFIRNFVTISLAAVLDGILMIGFFINKFSLERVFTIFAKEVGYKCLYVTAITAVLMIVRYVYTKLSYKDLAIAKK